MKWINSLWNVCAKSLLCLVILYIDGSVQDCNISNANALRDTALVLSHPHVDYVSFNSLMNPTFLKIMMTSSIENIFRVIDPLCGEFTGPGEFPAQRPVTRSFDVFFDLRLNKRLSKQPRGWWFETPPCSLWRQRNVLLVARQASREPKVWFRILRRCMNRAVLS